MNDNLLLSKPLNAFKSFSSFCIVFIFAVHSSYAQPSIQSSNIAFESIESGQFTVRFTKGDGEKRAVFIKEGSTGTVTLNDNTTYTPDVSFGSGSLDESSKWFCVYNGTDSVATISGLAYFTEYRVMAIEYNGGTGSESYLSDAATNNPNNQSTGELTPPEIPVENLTVTDSTSYSASLSWTGGSGSGRIILMKLTNSTTETPSPSNYSYYQSHEKFGLGAEVGTGWFTVGNHKYSSVSVDSLLPDTTYRVAVINYNGDYGKETYSTYFKEDTNIINFRTRKMTPPSVQTKNIIPSSLQPNSIRYRLQKGDGEKRVVFVTDGTDNDIEIQDSISYVASTDYESGSAINGWYCVHNGYTDDGYSNVVNNLVLQTAYRFAVFEYNGPEGMERFEKSQNANNVKSFTTGKPAPTIQVSDLNVVNINDSAYVSWTPGNGDSTVIFVKQSNSETFSPDDYQRYSANNGCLSNIKESWQYVYNGSGNSVLLANLPYDANIRFLAYAYNNGTSAQTYNTDIVSTENQFDYETAVYVEAFDTINPTVSTSPYATRVRIGLGSNCMSRTVWVKATNSTTDFPTLTDNNGYVDDTVFSTGSQIDGWYCVYNGRKTSIDITGLAPLTDYRVYTCSYVNEGGANRIYSNTLNGVNAENFSTLDKVLFGYSSQIDKWDPPAFPTATDDIIILGGAIVSSLEVNNIDLRTSVEISSSGHVTMHGNLITNGNTLTISNKGTFLTDNTDVSCTYSKSTAADQWLPFSTPFVEDFTSSSTSLYIKQFDEDVTRNWEYISSLENGAGAIIYETHSETKELNFSGTLQIASKDVPVTFTPGYSFSGFNLIGNPFAMNLDWNHETWDKSGLNESYWVYKPSEGNYASYNGTVGTLGANQYIAPGTSFWTKTNQSRNLSIPKEARTHEAPGFKSAETNDLSMVRIKAFANNYSDETIVAFNEDAELGPDDFDALKFDGTLHAPQLNTTIGKDNLSLNYLPNTMLQAEQYIPVKFSCTKGGNYTLELSADGFNSNDTEVLFVDKKTNTQLSLNNAQSYSFSYETSEDHKRFALIFKALNVSTVNESIDHSALYNYKNTLYVYNPSQVSGTLKIYNISGALVKQINHVGLGQSSYGLPYQGFYIAVFETDNFRLKRKVILSK